MKDKNKTGVPIIIFGCIIISCLFTLFSYYYTFQVFITLGCCNATAFGLWILFCVHYKYRKRGPPSTTIDFFALSFVSLLIGFTLTIVLFNFFLIATVCCTVGIHNILLSAKLFFHME